MKVDYYFKFNFQSILLADLPDVFEFYVCLNDQQKEILDIQVRCIFYGEQIETWSLDRWTVYSLVLRESSLDSPNIRVYWEKEFLRALTLTLRNTAHSLARFRQTE
jgi:hypothetical protein